MAVVAGAMAGLSSDSLETVANLTGLQGTGDSHETPMFYKGLMQLTPCLLYTSPSPRDRTRSRMPSSA